MKNLKFINTENKVLNRIIRCKLIFCIGFFSLLVSTINAQEPIWAKSVTSSDYEYGVDADIDSQGNIFMVGYGTGSIISMDTITINTNGRSDAFIAKLSYNKELLWFRTLGGDDNVYYDEAFDIHVDNNDDVIILVKSAGSNFTYNGDTLSDINSRGQYSGEGVIIKIDNNGNYLWHDDGSVSSSFQDLTTDSANNVYLTGWFSSSIFLGDTLQLTNPTSGTTKDMFVAKYSSDGAILWAKNVGGAAHNVFAFGHNIEINESLNKIFIIGRFQGDIAFETDILSTNRSYSTFLVAYNTNGTELWNKSVFNFSNSYCHGLDISSKGLIGIAGYNSLSSNPDGLVGFYDINGNMQSEEIYSSTKYCRLYNLEFNHLDECFITGYFQDSLTIGTAPNNITIATSYSSSGLIVKLSDEQVPIWTMQRSTSFDSKVTCKNGSTLFSCRIDKPFVYNFGTNSIINNYGDAVFAEIIETCSTWSSFSETVCDYYTSPSGKIWTISDTYIDTIPNAIGCDSIITINLTVNNSSTSSITEIACNSYTSPSGKIWTISNTYTDTIPNAVDCDSIIRIDLTIGCSNSIFSNKILKSSIYPNPADDKVIVDLVELSSMILVEIFNLTGQLILSEEYFNVKQVSIDLKIPSDTYLIRVINEEGNSNLYKVLKQ